MMSSPPPTHTYYNMSITSARWSLNWQIMQKFSFHLVGSFCMKLSSTPASKTNISASPGESHMELEGASTCKEPTIQTDLQARKNHMMYSTFHEFCACL